MQSSWAKRRKISFLLIGLLILLLIGVGSYFTFFKKAPNCFDGVLNQNERGVDCGGVCVKICAIDIADPLVLWSRAFEVQTGTYSAVAYIRNTNLLSEVHRIPYVFRFYDAQNKLLGERSGTTFIPPNQVSAIFEPMIQVQGQITRTVFSFTEIPVWNQVASIDYYPTVQVATINAFDTTTTPQVEATITNTSRLNLARAEATIILYTAQGLAVGSSRTIVENLKSGETRTLFFTWPKPWTDTIARYEIIIEPYPQALLQ